MNEWTRSLPGWLQMEAWSQTVAKAGAVPALRFTSQEVSSASLLGLNLRADGGRLLLHPCPLGCHLGLKDDVCLWIRDIFTA